MGHMEIGLNQDTCLIGMTQSNMAGSWIHLIGGVITMGSILVLVHRGKIIIIVTIHRGGMRSSTFQRSSGKKSLLHLMEK